MVSTWSKFWQFFPSVRGAKRRERAFLSPFPHLPPYKLLAPSALGSCFGQKVEKKNEDRRTDRRTIKSDTILVRDSPKFCKNSKFFSKFFQQFLLLFFSLIYIFYFWKLIHFFEFATISHWGDCCDHLYTSLFLYPDIFICIYVWENLCPAKKIFLK